MLWVLLASARREIQSTWFNRTPETNYYPAQNTQTLDGEILGDLRAIDADDDQLTFTVTDAPQAGTVTVNPDGSFRYTPDAALASSGGTDTFTVTADDRPGNPFHIHGLATFFSANGGATAETRVTVLVQPSAAATTGPLGTADQVAAEKLAEQVVNTPLVQLAKALVKSAWLAEAQKQFALVGGPDQRNIDRLDQAVDEYARLAVFEQQSLNPNDPKVLEIVAPPHTWYGETFAGSRNQYDNPDTVYRLIGVNSESSYVISGRFEGGMPVDTSLSVIAGLSGETVALLSGNDIQVAPDGTFTITADSSPAAPGQANHIQLPANAQAIVARNTLSDWDTQAPMSLAVERVSGPRDSAFTQIGALQIPLVGPLLQTLGDALADVGIARAPSQPSMGVVIAETALLTALGALFVPNYMAVATTDPATGELYQPNELSAPASNLSFLATQKQSAGYFQLADDEALVLTVDPADAGYFVVPVTDVWTTTNNYWDEQTSLNNAQAVANPDGTYTFVVSPTDPGVANWVSTGGLNQGTMSIRFQALDPNSTTNPTVDSHVVGLDQLSTVLPATTQYVTSQEREAQIAERRSSFDARFAPYPQT